MRVLWISNIEITSDHKSTGSWIFGMAHALMAIRGMSLGIIIPANVKEITPCDFESIQQWKIPFIKHESKSSIETRDRKKILDITSVFKPDILHVWGIENGFALITPYINCPVLVEIQGINSEIAKHFFGGLSLIERLKTIGLKETVTLNPLFRQRHKMARMKRRELRILEVNKYFTTPTSWMRANVESQKNSVTCFSNGFVLRNEFYNSVEWRQNGNNIILTSASYVCPYKGLHVLLDAIHILKIKRPSIKLHIIGPYIHRGIRTSGYFYFLLKKIKKLNLENNIKWLGTLNAKEICEEIRQSSVFVNSSFIESAGLTILEAMSVGIPIVSSFAGGIPSFSSGSVMYFQPGDYKMCAFQISESLTNENIILSSSRLSRSYIDKYHNKEAVVTKQMDIYKTILDNNSII